MNRKDDRGNHPKPGDCWSLRSTDRIAALAAVLLEPLDASEWLAAPLFADEMEAGENDLCLEPGAEWLFGENWCAAGNPAAVATERLYAKLGQLPAALFNHIMAARRGEACSLKRGPLILKALGDPRIDFHETLEMQLVQCGRLDTVARAALVLRQICSHAQARWEAVRDEVRDTVEFILRPVPMPVPVMRSSAVVADAAAWNTEVPGFGTLTLEVHGAASGITLALRGNHIERAIFRRDPCAPYEPCELINGTWLAGELDPIQPGTCLLRLQDEKGKWLELTIQIPDPA